MCLSNIYTVKKEFWSSLNTEDITNITICGSNQYIIARPLFEFFQNKCIHFFSASWLAWQTPIKINAELELLTNIHMILMIKKRIRGGKCHAIHQNIEANNKYMEDCGKKRIIIFYISVRE